MRLLKRIFKWFLWTILGVFILANLVILLSGRLYIYKAIGSTYFRGYKGPSIYDLDVFEKREVPAGTAQPWIDHEQLGQFTINADDRNLIEGFKPAAFLVLWGDTLIFEEYWNEHSEERLSNSFSMGKSIVSLLIGVAQEEGYIKSLDEPVANYIPEFKGEKENITIRHVLTMSTGLSWSESYKHPFCDVAELYYDTDDRDLVLNRRTIEHEPGEIWHYKSGDTQLLVYILEAAIGRKTSEYASEKLWKPMGAEAEAYWSLNGDENSSEKGFCCFYARSRDFLRLGKLINNKGNWNGKQLVPEQYVEEFTSLAPLKKENGKMNNCYGYQYWIYTGEEFEVTYYRGLNGQYIISIPEKDLVIVRTGHSGGNNWKNIGTEKNDALEDHRTELPDYIRIGLCILEQAKQPA